MSPALISREQLADRKFMQAVKSPKATEQYYKYTLEGVELYTHLGKVVVPRKLQGRIVAWYHHYLGHPGATRLANTINQTLWWPSMRRDVDRHVAHCKKCQLCKKTLNKKYGHLPAKEAKYAEPWKRVNVDMVGPMKVQDKTGKLHEFLALTMIDPATGWFEVKDVPKADTHHVSAAFDDTWLARYPRPQELGIDNGSEFKLLFEQMCKNYGLKSKPSSAYNPQSSNGIVERVHQVLNNILRTSELEKRELNERDPWSEFMAAVGFAIRSTYHMVLQTTPGQLVFRRDMILPAPFEPDWEAIKARRQAEINRNNTRENKDRVKYEHKPGDKVLYIIPCKQAKLKNPRTGPHLLCKVNNNGTCDIQRGAVTETVNIRQLVPFKEA